MKITATFSNGKTISRNTYKPYSHAYMVTNQWQTFTGFASSESLAKKAANMQYGNIEFLEIVTVNS